MEISVNENVWKRGIGKDKGNGRLIVRNGTGIDYFQLNALFSRLYLYSDNNDELFNVSRNVINYKNIEKINY